MSLEFDKLKERRSRYVVQTIQSDTITPSQLRRSIATTTCSAASAFREAPPDIGCHNGALLSTSENWDLRK